LPFFQGYAVSEITFDTVERYIAAKNGKLSTRSINMTVGLLAQMLETAVERDLIARNPARGRRRRAKERTAARSYLTSAGEIEAPLSAAGELDAEATVDRRHIARKAMLATLIFAGLRIGELCSLTWRRVDLASGWLTIADAKTDAGRGRRVKIRGALRDELANLRTRSKGAPDSYVFPTSAGGPTKADNFRNRVLAGAVRRANGKLAKAKLAPLADGLTPHSLRRMFAPVL
jgi:integrase